MVAPVRYIAVGETSVWLLAHSAFGMCLDSYAVLTGTGLPGWTPWNHMGRKLSYIYDFIFAFL